MLRFLILAALLPCALPASGQDAVGVNERFGLFAACQPMSVVVADQSKDAIEIGLTTKSIQALAEGRLRAARLYKDSPVNNALLVLIWVEGLAFNISVEFIKRVRDEHGKTGLATTWSANTTGTHGRSETYVMFALSDRIDEFIVKYLRVNETDCQH